MSLPHSPPGNPSSLSSGLSSPTIGLRTPALPVPSLPSTTAGYNPAGRVVRSPTSQGIPIGRQSATGSPLSPPRGNPGFISPTNSGSPGAFALQRPLGSPRLGLAQDAWQTGSDEPHLVTLVLISKKALQHGEHLCTLAHVASNASVQSAVDVLALDAKIKWLSGEVLQQLKLAASVAKSIEEKRATLQKQVEQWDSARSKHTIALDNILDTLGKQLVPPEFHQMSADSSLFGSQPGFNSTGDRGGALFGEQDVTTSPLIGFGFGNGNGVSTSPVSPSATLRRAEPMRRYSMERIPNGGPNDRARNSDRRYWKTLRDFIDDQAIEDTLDGIEKDRNALENTLAVTDDYAETLYETIANIEASLPTPTHSSTASFPFPTSPSPSSYNSTLQLVQEVISAQEGLVTNMAHTLENLAGHYDSMATALKESESGEMLGEDEIQTMSRDTEELRTIMHEMERDMEGVEGYQTKLKKTHDTMSTSISKLAHTLTTLDSLGDILDEMLTTQDQTEHSVQEALAGLQHHLVTLEELHRQFEEYRTAFDRLLVEIQRRRHYRDAVDEIIRGMGRELGALAQEESRVRSSFNAQYGTYLPEDLCLCIGNLPTKWEVVPSDDSRALELGLGLERETTHTRSPTRRTETLPRIDKDLVDLCSGYELTMAHRRGIDLMSLLEKRLSKPRCSYSENTYVFGFLKMSAV